MCSINAANNNNTSNSHMHNKNNRSDSDATVDVPRVVCAARNAIIIVIVISMPLLAGDVCARAVLIIAAVRRAVLFLFHASVCVCASYSHIQSVCVCYWVCASSVSASECKTDKRSAAVNESPERHHLEPPPPVPWPPRSSRT